MKAPGFERVLYNSYFVELAENRCFLRFDVDVSWSLHLSKDLSCRYLDGAIYFHHAEGRCLRLSGRWNGMCIHEAIKSMVKAVANPVVLASIPANLPRLINTAIWSDDETEEVVLLRSAARACGGLDPSILNYRVDGEDYFEVFYKSSVRQKTGHSFRVRIDRDELVGKLTALMNHLLTGDVFDVRPEVKNPE